MTQTLTSPPRFRTHFEQLRLPDHLGEPFATSLPRCLAAPTIHSASCRWSAVASATTAARRSRTRPHDHQADSHPQPREPAASCPPRHDGRSPVRRTGSASAMSPRPDASSYALAHRVYLVYEAEQRATATKACIGKPCRTGEQRLTIAQADPHCLAGDYKVMIRSSSTCWSAVVGSHPDRDRRTPNAVAPTTA